MMMNSWWAIWMLMMFVFLVAPIGYGSAYRGWGTPYPRYIQRRRAEQAASTAGSSSFNHQSWGLAGDVLWFVLLLGMLCAFAAVWWR